MHAGKLEYGYIWSKIKKVFNAKTKVAVFIQKLISRFDGVKIVQ